MFSMSEKRLFAAVITVGLVTGLVFFALSMIVFSQLIDGRVESALLNLIDEDSVERSDRQQDLSDRLLALSYEDRLTEVARLADPAVVSVVVELNRQSTAPMTLFDQFFVDPFGGGGERGSGTGFIVSADGFVVTNRHVVEAVEASYSVLTNDGHSFAVEVVARDPVLDIALLRLVEPPADLSYLPFGNSDDLRLGQGVMAIGNALGEFQNSVSVGVVSGLSRSVTAQSMRGRAELLDEVIQTDAAINFGNSGGPLLNLDGEVIGVNVAVAVGQQNIGFAIPSNLVAPVVTSVQETGRIVRAFLGIRYAPVTPFIQQQEGLGVDYGVLVIPVVVGQEPSVVPGSPADRAGLQPGDVILEFDGQRLDREFSLAHIIRRKSVGDEVELLVFRAGREFKVSVTLDEAPE